MGEEKRIMARTSGKNMSKYLQTWIGTLSIQKGKPSRRQIKDVLMHIDEESLIALARSHGFLLTKDETSYFITRDHTQEILAA